MYKCYLYLISIALIKSLVFTQNFRYTSDDWYIIQKPGKIVSISEDNFHLYFATENNIYIYDKINEDFKYGYLFSTQLDLTEIKHFSGFYISISFSITSKRNPMAKIC